MKNGYCGKITNKGAQVVKAPYAQSKTKGTKVKTGEDLRAKNGGNK